MIELHILGTSRLEREDGSFDHSFLTGPKRLALLTYLLLARPGGFQRRDKLVTLFWPEAGQKRARNALSNMLYQIRNSLGDDVVVNRGTEEITINQDHIWCDVIAFEEALNNDEIQKAVDIYRDDLLLGFHVAEVSKEFQNWLDAERERLRQEVSQASWRLSEKTMQAGNYASAKRWAKKAVSYTKLSEEANMRLIKLLKQIGDRSGALKAYQEFELLLKKEWDIEPSPELKALAEKIRSDQNPKTTKDIHSGKGNNSRDSIAVLPFETIGASEASAFTIGVHGDILTRLSDISDLQVISRTSVRKYANTQKTVTEIGKELKVTFVLEGDVQENEDQVQLNVRLINAQNDLQIWGQDYLRELTAEKLFQIQSEVTKEIADALKAELTPQEKRRVERRPTESLAAYRLYAQGRSWLDQRTEEGMRRAHDNFDRAIKEDSSYALAWVGLADTLSLLYDYGFEEAEDVLPKAEDAVRKALELDQGLAEAHASLGLLYSNQYDGPAAISELKQAVELRNGYAEAHNWSSWVSLLLGNHDQALTCARNAVDLDPLSPEAVSNLSLAYLTNGESEKALQEARRVCELQPTWTTGPFYEALALYHLGRFRDAISILKNLKVPWAGVGPQATVALAHISTGEKKLAEGYLSDFEESKNFFAVGLLWAALGKTDKAFAAFERIERWHAWPSLAMHHFYPEPFYSLKKDPRFQKVFYEMNESWGIEQPDKQNGRATPHQTVLSIAVLPFVSLGKNEQEIFVNGIHDDLLTRLSRISGLEVTSRTSVIRYKNMETSLQMISGELGVNWIVEGSVQQIKDQVQVRVRLVNTVRDRQVWTKDFQKKLTVDNLFQIQSEITKEIADALKTELTPEEKRRVERRPTESLDAYRLYMQGWSWVERRTEKGMRRGLDYFNQAVAQDPGFTLATVGRSLALLGLYGYGFEGANNILSEAEKLIMRALEQDPGLAEAHAALGLLLSTKHQGPEAIRELKQAVKLRPGYANAHNKLSWVYQLLGNEREALVSAKKAVDLDPFSPEAVINLSFSYLINGEFEKALKESRRVKELQPTWTTGPFYESLALYHMGKFEEAKENLHDLSVEWAGEGSRTTLALAHVATGDKKSAKDLLKYLSNSNDYFAIGLVHAALGEKEKALTALEHVEYWGDWPTQAMHHLYPEVLESLKDDARFQKVFNKMIESWGG